MSLERFKPKIEIDEINTFPIVRFEGELQVVDTPEQLLEIVPTLYNHTIWGFDTETKPSFKRGLANKVSLMQISSENTCYLVRLHKTGMRTALVKWMEDPSIKKIGLSLKDDMRELNKLRHIKPKGFTDLQEIVGDYGIHDLSLKKVTAIVLGSKISKKQRLTNWEVPNLTESQMRYAATDAWICLKIYEELLNGNSTHGH